MTQELRIASLEWSKHLSQGPSGRDEMHWISELFVGCFFTLRCDLSHRSHRRVPLIPKALRPGLFGGLSQRRALKGDYRVIWPWLAMKRDECRSPQGSKEEVADDALGCGRAVGVAGCWCCEVTRAAPDLYGGRQLAKRTRNEAVHPTQPPFLPQPCFYVPWIRFAGDNDDWLHKRVTIRYLM